MLCSFKCQKHIFTGKYYSPVNLQSRNLFSFCYFTENSNSVKVLNTEIVQGHGRKKGISFCFKTPPHLFAPSFSKHLIFDSSLFRKLLLFIFSHLATCCLLLYIGIFLLNTKEAERMKAPVEVREMMQSSWQRTRRTRCRCRIKF